jgi:V8-like Glu-specific endopeptidase
MFIAHCPETHTQPLPAVAARDARLFGAAALCMGAVLLASAAGIAAAETGLIGEVAFADGFEIDASVSSDLADLEDANFEALRSLLGAGADGVEVEISYVGKGRVGTGNAFQPEQVEAPVSIPAPDADGFSAFNPATRNEFRIRIRRPDLALIGTQTTRAGLDVGAGAAGLPVPPDNPDSSVPGRALGKAWSNNDDNRTRLSSLTVGTTRWPWRTIVEHSNRCSGTLVGPRHVVTAGHCIYSRTSNTWNGGFNITPGRAGGNWSYDTLVFPSAGFSWYFTPWQWRVANPAGGSRQYDIGILVLPQRLGEQTGWMGYAAITSSSIQTSLLYNRGFPWCNAVQPDGTPRADDVGDDATSGLVCSDRHLYGDASSCSAGEFAALDGQNWARLMNHSCDASAGQSGSPLYRYLSSGPAVIGVHTFSACGKTTADVACTLNDVRPLTATRITPEYRDWISYFRSWKP